MANNNSGVEIPVIIDIEQACKDAAARVDKAMEPLRKELEGLDLGKNLREAFKDGAIGVNDLYRPLKQVQKIMKELAMAGDTRTKYFKELKGTEVWIKSVIRASKIAGLSIQGMEDNLSGLNARLQASRLALENSAIGSPEWENAAKEIAKITDEIAKAKAQLKSFGNEAGSLNSLQTKLSELEKKWAALSGQDRSREAIIRPIVDEYRQITTELQKEGKTLSQIIAEEQKRNQLAQHGLQNRKYEQFTMTTLAKTVSGLRQQAQFLKQAMDNSVPNTEKWNQYRNRLEKVNEELNRLTGKTREQKASMDATNSSLERQSKLWQQLRSLAGTYLSVFGGLRLLQNIRETTSQFELQRVALGAIIHDTQKATSLFKQLKAAALESPFEIKDLVTYTKQLAAYQIETDKLFETTKKLADVSAGLGVDMGRLILAYGQVRAASVLRGQELRQFTEAGVPLVDKLAEKFSQLRGELVSTGEVFELISKRAVPFSMISEIFDDMTARGGIFYDMQRKQSETLYGQWQKLKDAASIMYDEIGNTSIARRGLEGIMKTSLELMRHWRDILTVLGGVVAGFAVMKVRARFLDTLTKSSYLYRQSVVAMERAQVAFNNANRATSRQLIAQALLLRKASQATNMAQRAWYKLRAAIAGIGWPAILITGLTTLVSLLTTAGAEARRLRSEMEKIGAEASLKSSSSVNNFIRLAKTATDATKSISEQNDAIAELIRTYSEIIPTEKLQREYLQGLKGDYTALTNAIKENIQMEAKKQKADAIQDTYSTRISDKQKNLRKALKREYGFTPEDIDAFFTIVQEKVEDGTYNVNATIQERGKQLEKIMADYFNRNIQGAYFDVTTGAMMETLILNRFQALAKVYSGLNTELKSLDTSMADLIGSTGKYAHQIEEMEKRVAAIPKQLIDKGFKEDTFKFQLEKQRRSIEIWRNELVKLFDGIDISKAFDIEGNIDFKFLYKMLENAEPTIKNSVERIRKAYNGLVPEDKFVTGIQQKFVEMADQMGVSMDKMSRHLMQSNEDIEKYIKRLKDDAESYGKFLAKFQFSQKNFSNLFPDIQKKTKEMQEAYDFLTAFISLLEKAFSPQKTGGTKTYQKPKFITDLEEGIKFMKDFKKGYEDLKKYMTSEAALRKETDIMGARGALLGIDVEEQKQAATNLLGWYEKKLTETMEAMRKAGGKGGTLEELLKMDVGKNQALKDFQQTLLAISDAITDLKTSEEVKNLEKALNDLAEKVKRSEVARNFFQNILDLTGDKELAANLSVGIYGDPGSELADRIRENIEKAMSIEGIKEDSDTWKTFAQAAQDMDFRKVMEQIEQLPPAVQKAVKEAADAVEKYQADVTKNYAKLLMSYNDIEMQRVEIKNKAAKDIETIEKGLALELLGIQDKYEAKIAETTDEAKKIQLQKEKEAAEAEANARAKILKEGVDANKKYELSKLERDYRLFFSTVGVLSKESARKVYEAERKMLTEQFTKGQMSLAKYRRELSALDDQMKKNNQSQNLFVNYLSGGVDGLVAKIKDYSEGLQGIVATMAKNKEDGTAIFGEGDKEYINKMGMFFGGKIFGVSGRKDVFKKMIEANKGDADKLAESLAKAASKIAALGEGFAQGVAIADLWVQNIGNAIIELNKLGNSGEKASKWWSGFSDFVMKTGMPFPVGLLGKSSDSADRFAAMNEYAMQGFEKFTSGNFVGAFADTVRSWETLFVPSVKAAERELKKQQEILSELEYQYKRLDVAIDKAFGEDYIYNYNKQLENLVAQQEAYLKQAELERSKGKKKDKDKIKDYEDKARETADKIADMQSQLSEFFTGTDLTSAAEDFATAWIDAYKEFANTTDAMKQKFNDMIESMITRSLSAKIMQTILQPLFDQIDQMARDGDLSTTEIAEIARIAPAYVEKMNEAMTAMANDLTAAGYNIRGNSAKLTGISRDIAGASEESILGLSAAINTQNFYISNIPIMRDQLSQIIALMGGGTQGNTAVSEAPETDLKLQYLSYLPTIASDVNEILVNLKRVISPNGAHTATHYISMR